MKRLTVRPVHAAPAPAAQHYNQARHTSARPHRDTASPSSARPSRDTTCGDASAVRSRPPPPRSLRDSIHEGIPRPFLLTLYPPRQRSTAVRARARLHPATPRQCIQVTRLLHRGLRRRGRPARPTPAGPGPGWPATHAVRASAPTEPSSAVARDAKRQRVRCGGGLEEDRLCGTRRKLTPGTLAPSRPPACPTVASPRAQGLPPREESSTRPAVNSVTARRGARISSRATEGLWTRAAVSLVDPQGWRPGRATREAKGGVGRSEPQDPPTSADKAPRVLRRMRRRAASLPLNPFVVRKGCVPTP